MPFPVPFHFRSISVPILFTVFFFISVLITVLLPITVPVPVQITVSITVPVPISIPVLITDPVLITVPFLLPGIISTKPSDVDSNFNLFFQKVIRNSGFEPPNQQLPKQLFYPLNHDVSHRGNVIIKNFDFK